MKNKEREHKKKLSLKEKIWECAKSWKINYKEIFSKYTVKEADSVNQDN